MFETCDKCLATWEVEAPHQSCVVCGQPLRGREQYAPVSSQDQFPLWKAHYDAATLSEKAALLDAIPRAYLCSTSILRTPLPQADAAYLSQALTTPVDTELHRAFTMMWWGDRLAWYLKDHDEIPYKATKEIPQNIWEVYSRQSDERLDGLRQDWTSVVAWTAPPIGYGPASVIELARRYLRWSDNPQEAPTFDPQSDGIAIKAGLAKLQRDRREAKSTTPGTPAPPSWEIDDEGDNLIPDDIDEDIS